MWMILFFVLLGILFTAVTLPRNLKDIQKKRETVNAYAIQNVKTGKDIRVHNASINDEAKIILYSHHSWECMTWQFIQLEGDTYLLKNLYTQKTFRPSLSPASGVDLWQQPLGGDSLQYWEFLKQADEKYLIRLKDTELYITVTSDSNNSPIVLMPLQNTTEQQWVLIRQSPIM